MPHYVCAVADCDSASYKTDERVRGWATFPKRGDGMRRNLWITRCKRETSTSQAASDKTEAITESSQKTLAVQPQDEKCHLKYFGYDQEIQASRGIQQQCRCSTTCSSK
ncbi:hypothetical protein Pcinc_001429 [Petrolisthes cinctipes]|uniref:Uncharacterized protein n=1 Tax=Petrolisthes cinctipes TaxID=88211 RepID=A0AAE1GMZ6_PETCI|nr:hypothetical protein Pcinc_001429 [Petrolisthes cinctipes]